MTVLVSLSQGSRCRKVLEPPEQVVERLLPSVSDVSLALAGFALALPDREEMVRQTGPHT